METQRIALVTQMDPYVGKYYSVDYIRRNILGHKEQDIKEQDKQMKKEIDMGIVMDPIDVNTFDTMDRQNDAFAPEIDAQNAEDDHKRDMEQAKQQAKLKPAPTKTTSNTK
ncbi:MAG: portal protein, partial [Candidatus Thermoplasmatota archaeon]|nr:portal protein [Candidatus Thermoplasmatota archaeon]